MMWMDQDRATEFAEKIRQARKEKQLTQRELAKKSGLSPGFISMLEKGVNPSTGKPVNPSADTLFALAKGLDISYPELMVLAGYLSVEHVIDGDIHPDILEDNIDSLAFSIQNRRQELGLSLNELAAATGLNKQYLEDLENCYIGDLDPLPGQAILSRIERALKMKQDRLFQIACGEIDERMGTAVVPMAAADFWEDFKSLSEEDQEEIRWLMARRKKRTQAGPSTEGN